MDNNTIVIHIEDIDPELKIELDDPDLKFNFDNTIQLKYIEPDHRKLDNLDYERSGHTGFMPSRLSLLPDVSENTSNERLVLSAFDNDNETAGKMTVSQLADRIIKTGSGQLPNNLQKGQYIFVEIEKESN